MKEENTTDVLSVLNSGFRQDAQLEVNGYEYSLLSTALDEMFQTNIKVVYPFKYKWVDQYDEPVENITEEQKSSGEFRNVLDVHATTLPSNRVEAYIGDMPFITLEAMRQKLEIHNRNLDKAVAIETLQKEMEQEQKSKLEIVE